MPTVSEVFSRIAESLQASGSQMSPLTLEIASSTMAFLRAINGPLEGDIAIAAFAASHLNAEEAKKVVATFGVSTGLIPTPPSPGMNELGLKLALLGDDQS